jgi:hypothetical protein
VVVIVAVILLALALHYILPSPCTLTYAGENRHASMLHAPQYFIREVIVHPISPAVLLDD